METLAQKNEQFKKVLHIEINCSNTSKVWVVALMENWERKNVWSLNQAICIWTKITNIFWVGGIWEKAS